MIWFDEGIHHEADQRHGEIAIKQLMLEDAKSVVTFGNGDEQIKAAEESFEFMSKVDASSCGMITARLNDLAMDRPILQFAVK